jgi:chemotaxis protein CheD
MNLVVGVADMQFTNRPGDVLVTHALGSCLGIAIYDFDAKVGGMLHAMLPDSQVSPDKAKTNPYMFIDTGTPLLFKQTYELGAKKANLIVKVAGGAAMSEGDDFFAIGKRNFMMLRKLFWQNGVMIANQDIGGSISRTMYLEIGTGRTYLTSGGRQWEL